MHPMWSKGDIVTIFQLSPSAGLLIEGKATVVRSLDSPMEHYIVRFHRKDGKLETQSYERFIDREGQGDPQYYIKEFNKRCGFAD